MANINVTATQRICCKNVIWDKIQKIHAPPKGYKQSWSHFWFLESWKQHKLSMVPFSLQVPLMWSWGKQDLLQWQTNPLCWPRVKREYQEMDTVIKEKLKKDTNRVGWCHVSLQPAASTSIINTSNIHSKCWSHKDVWFILICLHFFVLLTSSNTPEHSLSCVISF